MKKSMSMLVVLGLFLLFIGCSGDDNSTEGSIAQKMMDTVASTVASNLDKAAKEPTEDPVKLDSEEPLPQDKPIAPGNIQFGDMAVFGEKLYTITDHSLVVYDFVTKTEKSIKTTERLNAVAWHQDKLYAGGDALYTLNDSSLEFVDDQFSSAITVLYSYGSKLMIGTETGLYERTIFGTEQYLDDKPVSAITSDNEGLWVGTFGEGLYRWDGEEFKKRFLRRDTSFFDTVLTLDFNHNHLYMGTINGMHIFNGGSWTTLTEADGLPSNRVNAIDADGWVVYAGTNNGVISYFKEEFLPVKKLENMLVNDIVRSDRNIYVSTDYDGVLVKKGNTVKTVLTPLSYEEIAFLSLCF